MPRASSRGLKITYRCLLIPKSEAAEGLINYKFVLKCANFRPLEPPATLLTSIGVSHKLDSGKKFEFSTTSLEMGAAGGQGLKPDRGTGAEFYNIMEVGHPRVICRLRIVGASKQT